jgi:hypothetical protein
MVMVTFTTGIKFPIHVRFQVLTAASMKMRTFYHIAPCSLVEVYRKFRGACCLRHQGVDYSYETTRRYIPKGSHLHSPIHVHALLGVRNFTKMDRV